MATDRKETGISLPSPESGGAEAGGVWECAQTGRKKPSAAARRQAARTERNLPRVRMIERTFLARLAGFRGLTTGEGIPFSVGKPRGSARWAGEKVWYAIRRVGNGQRSTEGLLTEGSARRGSGGREAPLRRFAPLRSDNSENQQQFVEVAQVARVAALPNARWRYVSRPAVGRTAPTETR